MSELDSLLDLYKEHNQEETQGFTPDIKPSQRRDDRIIISKDANIDNLDEMIFGTDDIPLEESFADRIYNPHDELERLKKGLPKDLSFSRLPQNIIESFVNNPIDIPFGDEEMNNFTKRLAQKANFDRVISINEDIEKKDKKNNKVETKSDSNNNAVGSIDYNKLRGIIEEVIDSKIEALREANSSNVKLLKFGEKFLILDEDDSVYECVMEYKGKNKKRSK